MVHVKSNDAERVARTRIVHCLDIRVFNREQRFGFQHRKSVGNRSAGHGFVRRQQCA
jgi:hypothetical protein